MRSIAFSLAFCAAALLGLPGASFAQHGNGHGGDHSGHSGGNFSNPHTSGYYGHPENWGNDDHGEFHGANNWANYGHYPYYGYGRYPYYGYGRYPYYGYGYPNYGFGFNPWWTGLLGFGLPLFNNPWGVSPYNYGYGSPYYGGNYYGGNYNYGSGNGYAAAPGPTTSGYPLQAAAPSGENMDPNVANVEVRLPADATLWILGQKSDTAGEVRHFYSPPLKAGETYTYELRALWTDANGQTHDQTRKVDVQAGSWIGVDFTRPPLPQPI